MLAKSVKSANNMFLNKKIEGQRRTDIGEASCLQKDKFLWAARERLRTALASTCRCLCLCSAVSSTNEPKSLVDLRPTMMGKAKCWPKENLTRKKKNKKTPKKKTSYHSQWCVKNSWDVNTVNPRLGEFPSGEKFHRCSSITWQKNPVLNRGWFKPRSPPSTQILSTAGVVLTSSWVCDPRLLGPKDTGHDRRQSFLRLFWGWNL